MIALHRKYRPQTVAELDQEKVRNFFQHILDTGEFTQAYLFTGPKGTGKTSAARILAKIVNCEKNAASKKGLVEPCNTCDSCLAITRGSSPAVIEMDAASNRGIDDIRRLREQVNLIPAGALYSVYIIDEVHMLTTEAFNALLKTLEEPPAHVIFCLATTELHKLPATITSRCSVLHYQRSTKKEVERALARVVAGEKIESEPEALHYLANMSDGSFRDAVNLLQQVTENSRVSLETITQQLNISNVKANDLIETVLRGEVKKAFTLLAQVEQSNLDLKVYCKEIIEISLNQIGKQVLAGQPAARPYLDLIEIFSQAYKRFSDVPIPILPLEMAVAEFFIKNEQLQTTNDFPQSGSSPHRKSSVGPKAIKKETVEKKTENKARDFVTGEEADEKNEEAEYQGGLNLILDEVKHKWSSFLGKVADRNHGLVTLLKRSQVFDCQGNIIRLRVGYAFHKQQLEQERYLEIIEACLLDIFGGPVRIAVELKTLSSSQPYKNPHQNISGAIPKPDQDLATAVEEAFGL